MIEFMEFVFSGFWVWLGVAAFIDIVLSVLLKAYSRTMRCLMVRKHGWPPPHLDADGDWKPEKKQE